MAQRRAGGRVPRFMAAAGVATVMSLAAAGAAAAQPPPDPCSPAAMMRAHAAAMMQMADYLDTRPDVQQVFVDARGLATPQERHDAIKAFTDTHPDVAATFRNIHQPVQDLSTRCGLPMHAGMPGGMGAGSMGPGGMGAGSMGPGAMGPTGMAPGQ
ncbi:hemophore-related protein [Mycobacterium sp. B14F4]|uniref:hemophore-related protein n=1 Tax=Mycobacterium sp. B14F4 TaxID=3153565 RepID=UPI00325FC419